jgi:NTE family protein
MDQAKEAIENESRASSKIDFTDKTNFVFKGGSVKGLTNIGIRAALEACGFDFSKIKRIGGTSAGSITALIFALNITSHELKELLLDTDLKTFLNDSNSLVNRNMLFKASEDIKAKKYVTGAPVASSFVSTASSQLSSELGLFSSNTLREWIESLIFYKTKIRNCTFGEFKSMCDRSPEFKPLYIVGYNLSRQKAHTFSHETDPDVILADALTLSSSIPFIFCPHAVFRKVNNQRVIDPSNEVWVDGGLAENYPIRIFDWGRYIQGAPPDEQIFNKQTLGFYLVSSKRKNYFLGQQQEPTSHPTTIIPYTQAVVSAIYHKEASYHLHSGDPSRTIYVNDQDIGTLDFNLTIEEKHDLIMSGWRAVCESYQLSPAFPKELTLDALKAETAPSSDAKNEKCSLS